MKKLYFILCIFILPAAGNLLSESLFDSAVENENPAAEQNEENDDPSSSLFDNPASSGSVEYSGSVKGLIAGKTNSELSTENTYGEFRAEIRAAPSDNIKTFSEIIITDNSSSDLSNNSNSVDLREAYIDIYNDMADFSIGKKIVVWGKADSINPTNRITPYKTGIISANEDDRRDGNLLTEARINLYPFTVTAIWIPVYRQSQLPSFIDSELSEPDSEITNSSFALKSDFENSAFDFSVSYFNGFNPSPGITAINAGTMMLKPYRIHNIGFDFSTTISDYGLRGETAFLIPFNNHKKIHVPSPEISYVAGVDRSIGNFNLILQYSGKFITDFLEKGDLTGLNSQETAAEDFNRIISSQTDQITHSVIFRASADLFYETLSLETAGSWNFTTEELFLKPLIAWDAADSLTISSGALYYTGPENSLMGMLQDNSSSIFVEVKLCF